MKKIDSLEKLLAIKEDMRGNIAPRKLGNHHKDEVIEVKVYGNEEQSYDEIEEIFKELNEFSIEKNYENLRLKFKDNPDQKERYIVDISCKIKATSKDESFDKKEVVNLIESIAQLINNSKGTREDDDE